MNVTIKSFTTTKPELNQMKISSSIAGIKLCIGSADDIVDFQGKITGWKLRVIEANIDFSKAAGAFIYNESTLQACVVTSASLPQYLIEMHAITHAIDSCEQIAA